MESLKNFELDQLQEVKILDHVRLISRRDLNPIRSQSNLKLDFELSGGIKGVITSYLCLDNHELTSSDKNILYPLFIESMNILIGKLISTDNKLSRLNAMLSPPKLRMNSSPIDSSNRSSVQKYELEYEGKVFIVLLEYGLQIIS